MDLFELKKEQLKLAPRIILNDSFTTVKTIGGIECNQAGDKLLACIVVCQYPSMEVLEEKSFLLNDPLPYRPGFIAYREMPAMIEAVNKLENEPDLLLVKGPGILHPRKIGIASHLGLALNLPTIGVSEKLTYGKVENGKVMVRGEVMGFEIITREYAKPVYVSPGHQVSIGAVLNIIPKTIQHPHKLPEPLHLAHKYGKKKAKRVRD
jgi:deoxyribonuclease V